MVVLALFAGLFGLLLLRDRDPAEQILPEAVLIGYNRVADHEVVLYAPVVGKMQRDLSSGRDGEVRRLVAVICHRNLDRHSRRIGRPGLSIVVADWVLSPLPQAARSSAKPKTRTGSKTNRPEVEGREEIISGIRGI
jgi:hypothetical protein